MGASRRFLTRLALITAGAAAWRIWYVLGPVTGWLTGGGRVPTLGHDDEYFYSMQARLVADGLGFLNPFGYYAPVGEPAHRVFQTAIHPPLYTVFLSIPAKLGIDSHVQQRVLTALLGCVTVFLVGMLARRVSGHDGVGLLAAGIAAVYPPLWSNDSVLGLETLYGVLVVAALLATYRLWARPSLGNAALLALWLALATLTRSEGVLLFLALALPTALLVRGVTTGFRLKLFGVFALVGIVVVGPWVVRNLTTFEKPTVLGTGFGWVLLDGSCDATFYGDRLGYWDDRCALKDYPPDQEESLVDARARRLALDYLSEHKSRIPVVMAARVGRVFGVYRPFQNVEFDQFYERRGEVTSWAILLTYWALLPFAIGGLVVLRRRRVPIFPFVAVIGATVVTVAMSFGITRYRAGVDVLIPVLAAVAIAALGRRLRPLPAAAGHDVTADPPADSPIATAVGTPAPAAAGAPTAPDPEPSETPS
jgi:4-amino-4-deoxy-L-arabinose transferase-like glycosyltransferase